MEAAFVERAPEIVAEDVGLLPDDMFTRMRKHARRQLEQFAGLVRKLFGAMSNGGQVGFEDVEWLTGGLFEDHAALAVRGTRSRSRQPTLRAAALDGRASIPRSWACGLRDRESAQL